MPGSGDKRDGDRTPVGLLVRLSYGSVDEFVERFATNLSRGGIFIRTRSPKPPGTKVAFELKLANGETVVKGLGTVLWSRMEDPHSAPPVAPGMGVQFNDLDDPSRAIVERVMEHRERPGAVQGAGQAAPVAPRLDRVTPTTRAPSPAIPPTPPALERTPAALLQAAVPKVDLGLPAAPVEVREPSRHVIGIDLGTSNSCAAIVRDGKPYVIPSRRGRATEPSVVALNTRHVRLPSETQTLEQVSALILRELKEVAQDHVGEVIKRAVITVPAYYDERQRAAVRSAGGLAGFKVERLLDEPTAAALAFAHGRHVGDRVLVYDLGGGTFDASVLELKDDGYEVVATGGDALLGGVDFDDRIVERLLRLYEEQVGAPFDGDRVALSRLADAAERAKCALSERSELPIRLPYLTMKDGEPVTLDVTLTRADVVALVEPLVDRTLQVCGEVLAAKGLTPADVADVLLVGGQSRMPLVRQRVEAWFGRTASRAVHPEEAVGIGAALLAHSLDDAEEGAPDTGPTPATVKARAVTDLPASRQGPGFWGRLLGRREG